MSIKDYLKNSRTILFFRLLHEKFQEIVLLTKYIANGNRLNDKEKLFTDLTIRTHAIEKGMSIGSVRLDLASLRFCLFYEIFNVTSQ